MKIVVCVKQVAMLGDEVEFTPDERGVDPDYFEFALNEWDSYATEEALRIKEAAGEGEVVVVSCGDEEAEDAMRRCLAMGADRAVRIDGEELGWVTRSRRRGLWQLSWSARAPISCCAACSPRTPCRARRARHLRNCSACHALQSSRSSTGTPARAAVVDRELEGGLVDVVEVETPAS